MTLSIMTLSLTILSPEPTLNGAPLWGSLLALPTNIRLGWNGFSKDKHSSALRKLVNSIMFVGTAGAYPSEARFKCLTLS